MMSRSPCCQPVTGCPSIMVVCPARGSADRRTKVGDLTAPWMLTSPSASKPVPYCSGSRVELSGVLVMTISACTFAATGRCSVPTSSYPRHHKESANLQPGRSIAFKCKCSPWGNSDSRCLACDVVIGHECWIRTTSPACGSRAGVQVAVLDHASLLILLIVGFCAKLGMVSWAV